MIGAMKSRLSYLRYRIRVSTMSTSTLKAWSRIVDMMPAFLMIELRRAVHDELTDRELPSIAEESGGHVCAAAEGWN